MEFNLKDTETRADKDVSSVMDKFSDHLLDIDYSSDKVMVLYRTLKTITDLHIADADHQKYSKASGLPEFSYELLEAIDNSEVKFPLRKMDVKALLALTSHKAMCNEITLLLKKGYGYRYAPELDQTSAAMSLAVLLWQIKRNK